MTLTSEEIENSLKERYGNLIGKTITGIELDTSGYWDEDQYPFPVLFRLSNGSFFLPSMDDEGNGPGVLIHLGVGETLGDEDDEIE